MCFCSHPEQVYNNTWSSRSLC